MLGRHVLRVPATSATRQQQRCAALSGRRRCRRVRGHAASPPPPPRPPASRKLQQLPSVGPPPCTGHDASTAGHCTLQESDSDHHIAFATTLMVGHGQHTLSPGETTMVTNCSMSCLTKEISRRGCREVPDMDAVYSAVTQHTDLLPNPSARTQCVSTEQLQPRGGRTLLVSFAASPRCSVPGGRRRGARQPAAPGCRRSP